MIVVTLDRDVEELKAVQRRVAKRVVVRDEVGEVSCVAGFDAAYGEKTCYGAVVVVDVASLEVLASWTASAPIGVPYVPGFLAFRELPVLRKAWGAYPEDAPGVDALLVDGGGLIHPRRVGSACHAGVELGVPSVGVTKSLLLGEVEEVPSSFGEASPVREGEELLGFALLSSKRATNPIFVSPGHRVTARRSLQLVKRCLSGKRKAPEPIHRAHVLAGRARDQARGREGDAA